jgi:hypothetical protein
MAGAHNAIRLSSAPLVERYICNWRTTVRPRSTDAAVGNQRVHESHAH